MTRAEDRVCDTCHHCVMEFVSLDETVHTCTLLPTWTVVERLHYCGNYRPARPWWHIVR